jgi:hypothetical protein
VKRPSEQRGEERGRFFEKKRRKKLLVPLGRAGGTPIARSAKSFLLLFSKKKFLLAFTPLAGLRS